MGMITDSLQCIYNEFNYLSYGTRVYFDIFLLDSKLLVGCDTTDYDELFIASIRRVSKQLDRVYQKDISIPSYHLGALIRAKMPDLSFQIHDDRTPGHNSLSVSPGVTYLKSL